MAKICCFYLIAISEIREGYREFTCEDSIFASRLVDEANERHRRQNLYHLWTELIAAGRGICHVSCVIGTALA